MNTWPGGYRHAMDPTQHEQWNATHYPGTRQLCDKCGEPTGRCEDDSIYRDDRGPLCEECAGGYRPPNMGGLEMLEDAVILLLGVGALLVVFAVGAWWADRGDKNEH